MRILPLKLGVAASLYLLAASSTASDFTLIEPTIALASKSTCQELIAEGWSTADGSWEPSISDARDVVKKICTEEGRKQIISASTVRWPIAKSLAKFESSQLQVFGIVFRGKKYVYIEASPQGRELPFTTSILSLRVLDGGSDFWWVLYDVETRSFTMSSRRPES